MLEGGEFSGFDDDTITDDTYLVTAFDLTLTHNTAGDRTHFGDVESLQHFECSCYFFLHLRREHTIHSGLHLVDGIIDDRVDTDIHLFRLGHLTRRARRTNVEADDDGIRSRS